MGKNWAIAIGINKYSFLPDLRYAKADAEAMQGWFEAINCDRVFPFFLGAPPIAGSSGIPNTPTFGHLDTFFDVQFERRYLRESDTVWLSFSGHGMRGENGDYLMLSDSNPRRLNTALSVNYIAERLRNWGAGNIIMFLDACRNKAKGNAIAMAHYQGIVTFYSCRPKELSYEIESLQRGSFTHVLLETLQSSRKGLTVGQLESRLMQDVPALNQKHGKPVQRPLAKIEPTYKRLFPLLGEVGENELKDLKSEAKTAIIEDDRDRAKEILYQANRAAKGGDLEIVRLLARVEGDEPLSGLSEAIATPPVTEEGSISDLPEGELAIVTPPVTEEKTPLPIYEPEPLKIPDPPVSLNVELVSSAGVDYTQLHNALAHRQWQDADRETTRILLHLGDREEEGWLDDAQVEKLPREDLQTIDRLWLAASKGHFGLSVQGRIFEENGKSERKMGQKVGWFRRNKWLDFEALTWNLDAPAGHLPSLKQGEHFVVYWDVVWSAAIARLSVESFDPVQLDSFDFEVIMVGDRGQTLSKRSASARYLRQDLGDGVTLDLVLIPGGTFWMGTEEAEIERLCKKYDTDFFRHEHPRHSVTVQPFLMGKTPITQAQWRQVEQMEQIERELDPEPSRFKGDNQPVEQVSWEDAKEFCARLSKRTGEEYRLPSEAEWEYACRGGTDTPFHFGATITGDFANYNSTEVFANQPKAKYQRGTTPVDDFYPNAFGLYDMHGNVWEWCEDDWHENYEEPPTDGRAWITGDKNITKVIRGGSWVYDPRYCRSACRVNFNRVLRVNNNGFRVVRVVARTL
ncbi:MAG: SUMF1/EgtB/PvdO family nonheme iron enzyme [Spirulina sp.]